MSTSPGGLWREGREKGSFWGMLFTVALYRGLGRWAAEPVLWFVVAYFVLTDGRMRQASLQYQRKIAGNGPAASLLGWKDVYRHCLSFARTALDRFDVWTDRLQRYTFRCYGEEQLVRLVGKGQGVVLLGAHLGNFDMLRALAKRQGGTVHILTDRKNSQKFSQILRRFAPQMDQGVVEYDTGSVNVIFELKKAIERGEFVGLLGDRIAAVEGRGARRVSPAMFLGEQAFFPQAAFLFAAHLGCPVFLVTSLRQSHRVYDVYVEPFAERIDLPEGPREEALAQYAAAFAARLEHYCRLAPLQWFNFYDFWGETVMTTSFRLRAGQHTWTLEDIVAVAEGRAGVDFRPDALTRRRIRAGVAFVKELWQREDRLYGVTTGFGASVDRPVPSALVKDLSKQLARFHGCGLGDHFNEEQTLAILATRLVSLTQGYSGVRESVLQRLTDMINRRVLPLIPEEGSVGASGDLTPLSYVAAAIMGEGRVRFGGRVRPTQEVFKRLRWKPLELNPKEGLALMNGTSVMTALACQALLRASYLEQLASRITALTVLSVQGNPGHFDRQLFELKNHPGQARSAERIRKDLDAYSRSSPKAARLQDPYSLRCAPHVIGVLADALPWMRRQLETELNSSNDNPLIDGLTKRVMHGGHFYGGHVAFIMDSLKIAVANIADLLDRQLALLVDIRTSHGLPANISGATRERACLNHGFKAVQIGASAWTAEALKLTMPASVFSRSTECHNQDKVSMGTIAARDALRVLELTEQVAAATLLGALQGLDWRVKNGHVPSSALSPAMKRHYRAVRHYSAYVSEDRPLETDLRRTAAEIRRRAWELYG